MRIPPPRVLFEVRPLIDDFSQEPPSSGRRFVARLRRLSPNPKLLWETETDHPGKALARRDMLSNIRSCLAFDAKVDNERFVKRIAADAREKVGPAPEPPIDLDAVLSGIHRKKRDWSRDQVLSLAVEFIFPETLAELEIA